MVKHLVAKLPTPAGSVQPAKYDIKEATKEEMNTTDGDEDEEKFLLVSQSKLLV